MTRRANFFRDFYMARSIAKENTDNTKPGVNYLGLLRDSRTSSVEINIGLSQYHICDFVFNINKAYSELLWEFAVRTVINTFEFVGKSPSTNSF
jgi:hypothetical protein